MTPITTHKVVRLGVTVLVGSEVVCRMEARANGGTVLPNTD